MNDKKQLQIKLVPNNEMVVSNEYDFDKIIFDLDCQVDLLSSQADKYDYLVSVGSGILCGLLDILWVGEFSLERGRNIANDKVDEFVKKTAKMLGCKDNDLQSSVKFLEKKFPIPSDGNTPDFGGGLQHHLRDFAHHPTIVGLMFSLLTQFTSKSYGTDVNGCFIVADVPEKSKTFIGKDVPTKILFGTLVWFFHLVSDVAGSSSSVGKSGGTGIPGPILALAKELSVLPVFKNLKVDNNSLPVFLSKLFNGTLLAEHDKSGAIIKDTVLKFDLRGELGVGIELGRQAIPVIANECIVRTFYFLRRFAMEMRTKDVRSIFDMKYIDWAKVKPLNNPTIAKMLTISTGVFTTLDIGEAVISQKYWISVNYVGVGRFAIAIGEDVNWCLKARKVKKVKQMYEDIKRSSFSQSDEKMAFRCLVWVGLSGGDGAEVEFAAGQVDHGAEVVHVLESAGSGLDVLDDAVESFEDRVGVGVVEVGEDVPPVAAYLAGELFHGFESGARHPRAQTLEGRLGLGSIGAGVVDVLEGLAHLTGASGFQSLPLQAALGFQLQAGQVRFVPQPQVLGPLEQRVAAGLLFADLVDGLVGVFDHVELVDDSRRVGQPLADALGEPQAHVAGNQTHPVGIAVVVHEIPREPFDRGRVLARDHADYVALHQVGDHGDVPVALPAGLVDAYGLHARVVLVKPRLVHVMADEPP